MKVAERARLILKGRTRLGPKSGEPLSGGDLLLAEAVDAELDDLRRLLQARIDRKADGPCREEA